MMSSNNPFQIERVRTILTRQYPYPHAHSQHAITAVFLGCLFFISSDNMHSLVQKLDSNIKWWSMYICLFCFFYFFSSPFIGKTIKPSYSNFSRWCVFFLAQNPHFSLKRGDWWLMTYDLVLNFDSRYVAWTFIAALYHLPSFQSMGVDLRMNLSMFLTIYISSVLFLIAFHILFLGLWYIGFVARVAGKRPQILTIIQNCAVSLYWKNWVHS